MASKKIRLSKEDAGVILDYHCALHKESALILNISRKLVYTFRLENNDELRDLYEENLDEFGEISMLYSYRDIFDNLIDIFYAQKNRLPKNELLEIKGLYEDYLKTFKSNVINYFNKLRSIKKDEPKLVKAELEVLDSIENMRFLTNRIIKLIDSKI